MCISMHACSMQASPAHPALCADKDTAPGIVQILPGILRQFNRCKTVAEDRCRWWGDWRTGELEEDVVHKLHEPLRAHACMHDSFEIDASHFACILTSSSHRILRPTDEREYDYKATGDAY